MAAYKTTVYKLGKFLIPLIENFSKSLFSLQNSYDFYDSIVNNRRASGFLVSYDASSLYTNVPISESISILCDKIFGNSTTEFHGFSKTDFKQLLDLTLNNFDYFVQYFVQAIEWSCHGKSYRPMYSQSISVSFGEDNIS